MNTGLWVLIWLLSTAFMYWIVWGGGAARFLGWRALLIVDWIFSYRWTSEQIALYTLICWVGHTIWFLLGLFAPEIRTFYL
jgi:hypothetical protein